MDETKSEASPSGPEIASPPQTNLAGSTYHEEAVMSDAMNPSLQAIRFDAIELAGFPFLDELNAPLVAARPKPRGLLPVPSEVEAAIAEDDASLWEQRKIVPTAEERRRQIDSLTLQYYYGGHDVAYRLTSEGVELLAAGLSDIRQLVQGMSQEELLTLKIGQP
jgi:hypothetical protein